MHILYIHQYFATPNGSIVTRAYEFSKVWMAKGHKITMLTTTAKLTAEDMKNAKGRFLKKINIEGINVLAFKIPYEQKMSKIKRYLSWIAFIVFSVVTTLFTRNIDLIFARTTPLTAGIPAIFAKKLKKTPFVFDVTDQWPEVPIEMGMVRNKIIIKILLWLEKTLYKYSDAIIACSPGMANGVKEVMTRNKLKDKPIKVVPNFSETKVYHPDVDGSFVRKERGWDDKLVFLHAGSMGTANSLNFIIDVALNLREHPEILFVLIGAGNEKHSLEKRVKELGLTNVEISAIVLRQQLPAVIAAADISLVIFGNVPILQDNSANKFFDALAAGNPVLINYSGWQREVLEENNAGYGCQQYDPDEFVEKVLYLNSHRDELLEIGMNARRVAVDKYDRQKLAMEALNVIENVKLS